MPCFGRNRSDASVSSASSSSLSSMSAAAAFDSSCLTLLAPGITGHQAVSDLVAEHRLAERTLGCLPLFEREVAHAHVLDHALLLEPAHACHLRADRHNGVRPVDLVEVDLLRLQTAGARP